MYFKGIVFCYRNLSIFISKRLSLTLPFDIFLLIFFIKRIPMFTLPQRPKLRHLPFLLMLCGLWSPNLVFANPTVNTTAQVQVNVVMPQVMLAKNYVAGVVVKDYLISEKLDGVRAVWDGKQLRFRSGRVIAVPTWFIQHFPKTAMDGELWIGRGQFDVVSGATRKEVPIDAEWRQISYHVFDMPKEAGRFDERIVALEKTIRAANIAWLKMVPQTTYADEDQLQLELKKIVALGGEGLMLHRADATWEAGRSDALLKLKMQQDAEATVVGYTEGKGKYKGMIGALEMQTAAGLRFKLGSGLTDAQRQNPPAIGSIVTYRYRDLTLKGLPRFASFLRVVESD